MQAIQGIVPFLLIFIGTVASAAIAFAADKEARASGCAGVLAGLIVTVIFVISRSSAGDKPPSELQSEVRIDIFYLLVSVALGFGFTFVYRLLLDSRFIGCTTMFLSAASGACLYCAVAIDGAMEVVAPGTYGFILGYLLNIIVMKANV